MPSELFALTCWVDGLKYIHAISFDREIIDAMFWSKVHEKERYDGMDTRDWDIEWKIEENTCVKTMLIGTDHQPDQRMVALAESSKPVDKNMAHLLYGYNYPLTNHQILVSIVDEMMLTDDIRREFSDHPIALDVYYEESIMNA